MAEPDPTVVAKFLARVEKTEGCWLWTGHKDYAGYGQLMVDRLTSVRAHRLSWLIANGPIPAGMCVCHRCDNPSCVRLDHLFLGTLKDNAQDAVRKRRAKGMSQTHCKSGHPFDDSNTRWEAGTRRRCRTCQRAASVKYDAKRRAAR